MKKKSVLLFVLWAVAATILTCIYLALMMNVHTPQVPMIGWILFLCTGVLSLSMMSLIRTNAKAERITWLAVVSKVLMIFYSIISTVGLLMLFLSTLLV